MRIVRFALLLAFVIPLSLSAQTRLVTTGGADVGDCTVTPCATLTYAIGQANPGDTIDVGPGTFNNGGNPIVVDKDVTISGEQAGVNACGRVATESVITQGMTFAASGIIVDGFTLTCGGCGTVGAAISGDSVASGHAVRNNIITGNTIGISPYWGGTLSNAIELNSIFSNNVTGSSAGNGIYQDSQLTNTNISENCFTDNQNADIFILGLTGPSAVLVDSNVFTHDNVDDNNAIVFQNVDNSTILLNTITGGTASQIYLASANDDLAIFSNHITGGTDRSAITIDFDPFGTGAPSNGLITITQNVLRNNARALRLFASTLVDVEMHCNVIEDHSIADVEIDAGAGSAAFVQAQQNWWGCNAGPATCAILVQGPGGISADPWIVMDIVASPPSIPLSGTSTVTADFNQDSNGAVLLGCFPDGEVVTFSVTPPSAGTVTPPSAPTSGGAASTTFDPTTGGAATVNATLDDQTVSAPVTVIAADVAITGTVSAPTPGQTATKTLTITNNGPSPANNVTVSDPVVPGAVLSATPSQGSCITGPTSVTCNLGTLAPSATATITIQFTAPAPGPSSNTVTVTADEEDPVPGNNIAIIAFAVGIGIPTLSQWMLALFAALIAGIAVVVLKRA